MNENYLNMKNQKRFSLLMIFTLMLNLFTMSIMPVSAESPTVVAEDKSAPKEKVFKSIDAGNFTYDKEINSIGWFDKITDNNPDGGFVLGTRYKTDDAGTAVYCLNWDLDSPQEKGNTYIATTEKITDKEYTAMYYGYAGEEDRTGNFIDPKTNKEFSQNERYYITQMSLYAVTNDNATKDHLRVEDMIKHTRGMIDEEMSEEVLNAVKDQVDFINENTLKVPKAEVIEIVIEGSEDNEMIQKDTYLELKNPIQINVSNTKGELTLDNSGLNKAYFVDVEGEKVDDSYVLEGNEVFLRVDIEDAKAEDSIEFKVSGEVEYTNLTKYAPKNSSETGVDGDELQRITWVSKEKSEAESNFRATYEVVEGDIEITKKELGSDRVLPNAEFVIKDDQDNIVHEGKTNDEGVIKSGKLLKGKYTYQETKAPEGYVLDDTVYPFEIKENGEVVKVTVENKMIEGSLVIVKKDSETEEVLEGVEFNLIDEDNEVVETGKTDEEGKLSFTELPYGKYTLKETETLEGYVINKSVFVFEIEAEDQVVEKEITNSPIKGDLEITKTDVATGEALPNTKFEIKDSDGDVVREAATDEEGIAYFDNLQYGEYTYKEIEAVEGYVIDDAEYPFEIKENGEVVKAEVTNKPIEGDLEITKTDVSTGDLLPNAKFKIKDAEGEVVREGATDEDGIVYFENLPYGEYTYQEYDAPEGYVVDETEFPFEIKEDGQIVKAEVTNKQEEVPTKPEEPKEEKEETIVGEMLPKTATDVFNMLLIGFALVLTGGAVAFYMNKRKKTTDIGEVDESDKE